MKMEPKAVRWDGVRFTSCEFDNQGVDRHSQNPAGCREMWVDMICF